MLLSNLILIPLIGSFLVLFIPSQYKETIKVIVLSFSLAEFLLSLMMWMSFDNSSSRFQFVEVYNWIESSNIIFYLGVDGISLFFILLTTLLIPICLLASWDAIKFNEKEYEWADGYLHGLTDASANHTIIWNFEVEFF